MEWLDPTWRFATTVGEFAAAVVAAFVLGWAMAALTRKAGER